MLKNGHLATDSQHKARMLRHRAVEWAPRSSSGGAFLCAASNALVEEVAVTGLWCHASFLPVLKSRDIALSTKVHLVKAMVFSAVM